MLYLRTLGRLHLDLPGRLSDGAINQRRPLTLLAYLAVAGDGGVSREQLLAVFWPDTDIESARGALKQHVFALRKATGVSEIILGRDQLRLNPEVVQTDIRDFAAAARLGRTEDLLELYRGPFLDGVQGSPAFEAWVRGERARFAAMFEAALDRRVIELSAEHESQPAIPTGPAFGNSRTPSRLTLAVRYAAVGALCGILAMVAGVILYNRAPRYTTMSEVWDARFLAHKNDRRPRGRLFIETPINATGPYDSTLRARIDRTLRYLTGEFGDVVLVPEDSVGVIERRVSTQPGLQSPSQRLRLADSPLNAMTTYSIRGDSLNITVQLQRVIFPPIVKPLKTRWIPIASSRQRFPQIETWTVASYMTGIERPNTTLAAARLAQALRAMRSCNLRDHVEHELTPWCWRRENQLELIPGYFDVRHPRMEVPRMIR